MIITNQDYSHCMILRRTGFYAEDIETKLLTWQPPFPPVFFVAEVEPPFFVSIKEPHIPMKIYKRKFHFAGLHNGVAVYAERPEEVVITDAGITLSTGEE